MDKFKNKVFDWASNANQYLVIIVNVIFSIVMMYGVYFVFKALIYSLIDNGIFGFIKVLLYPQLWIGMLLAYIGSIYEPIKKAILCRNIPMSINNMMKVVIKVVTIIFQIIIGIIISLAVIILLIDNYTTYGFSWNLLYGFDGVVYYMMIYTVIYNIKILSFNEDRVQQELQEMIAEENK